MLTIYKDLKKAIINWLLDHENEWQRVNACHDAFRQYIFDANGEFIIGGRDTSEFISKADELLFGGK